MKNLLYLLIPAQDGPYGGNACDRVLILRILEVRDSQDTGPQYFLGLSDAIAELSNPLPGTVQAIYRAKDNILQISWVEDRIGAGQVRCDVRFQVKEAWSRDDFPPIQPVGLGR